MRPNLRTKLRSILESGVAAWIVVLVSLLLALPSVDAGFSSDDDIILPALDGNRIDAPRWYDLYHFAGRALPDVVARGILPWWSAHGLRLHFVRPLPSALLTLDHAVFGHAAAGYHLHSLAWFAALLALARTFFLRVLGPRAGTFATLVFAFSPNLMLASRLVAARHILVTAVCVMAGLIFLVQSEHRPRRRWEAGLAFAIGLAGGEGGLGGLGFWFAYETLGVRDASPRARIRRALVPVVLGATYLVAYVLVGGGSREMDIYIDPLGDPVAFVEALVLRLPMLLGNLIWQVDAGLGALWPRPLIAAGIAGTAIVAVLLKTTWAALSPAEASALRWLVPGALLATVGVVGGMPGGRELVVASFGSAPVLAVLLLHGWKTAGEGASRARWWSAPIVGLLALVHTLLAPLATVGGWKIVRHAAVVTEDVARQMKLAAGSARRVVLLTGSDPAVWIYALRLARNERPGPIGDGCWWLASAAKADHRVTRTGESALRVETDSTFLGEEVAHMYRARSLPMAVGDEVHQCGARVRVAGTRGGDPSRLDIELDVPLDHPDLALLTWRNGRIERIEAGEIARELTIPWSPGPIGM